LSKKPGRKRALRPRIVRAAGKSPHAEFEIFEPTTAKDVPRGTVALAKATCLACSRVLPPRRVRPQLADRRGNADPIFDDRGQRIGGARLIAVVTLRPRERGRHYRLPLASDYAAVQVATERLQQAVSEGPLGRLSVVPDEPTPQDGTGSVGGGFRTRKYGV